jgi:transposase
MDLSSDQLILLDLPEDPAQPKRKNLGKRKFKAINREQPMWATIYIEELIAPDHKARAIWELVGRMDLSAFIEPVRTTEGQRGAPAWHPQLLISLWVYAISEGITKAREIVRWMQWEPGMMWLAAMSKINNHSVGDIRVVHKEALDELFVQVLVVLESAEMINLEQVAHDGTKIRALAGADSFRREKTIRQRQQRAREVVEQLGDPRGDEEPLSDRKKAARERAAREREERLTAALEEVNTLQKAASSEEQKAEIRVSLHEPEARHMKHGDNAIAPSYNAQITTDTKAKIIVGVDLTQCSSDAQSLIPAMEEVERNLGRTPAQAIVDGGFTNRESIQQSAAREIDLVGSLPDPKERSAAAMKALGIDPKFAPAEFRILNGGAQLECPAGCRLERLRQNRKRGDLYQQYRASGEDCGACGYQKQCCPKQPKGGRTVSIRLEEQADVAAFRKKMEAPEYREIYRKRGAVAEFPNAWIKEKLGLRKFSVRGLGKARCELMWSCLTYNIMQWVRLVWRQPVTA